jgi:hypothetical protein
MSNHESRKVYAVGPIWYNASRNGTFWNMCEPQIEHVGDFKKLTAWQKSQELVACVYRLTSLSLPRNDMA